MNKMNMEIVDVSKVEIVKAKRGRKPDPEIVALVNSVQVAPDGKAIRIMARNEQEADKYTARIRAAVKKAGFSVIIGRIVDSTDILVTKKIPTSA